MEPCITLYKLDTNLYLNYIVKGLFSYLTLVGFIRLIKEIVKRL